MWCTYIMCCGLKRSENYIIIYYVAEWAVTLTCRRLLNLQFFHQSSFPALMWPCVSLSNTVQLDNQLLTNSFTSVLVALPFSYVFFIGSRCVLDLYIKTLNVVIIRKVLWIFLRWQHILWTNIISESQKFHLWSKEQLPVYHVCLYTSA